MIKGNRAIRKNILAAIGITCLAVSLSACSDNGTQTKGSEAGQEFSQRSEEPTNSGEGSGEAEDAKASKDASKADISAEGPSTENASVNDAGKEASNAEDPSAQAPGNMAADLEKWKARMDFPTQEEIDKFNANDPTLSPYVAAWMHASAADRFDEYSIEFKADYVPNYTYCCLGNFLLDYSDLEGKYASYSSSVGINGYAGFQYRAPGETPVAIQSIWDLYCTDEKGEVTTIRAQRVFPEPDDNETFTGEGDGVHCITDYDWKAGKWYRMLLKLDTSEITGNTTIEQQVLDLETGEWTLLSKYDLGVKNVKFYYDVAIFMEDYLPAASANVRTMEVRNVSVHPVGAEDWMPVRSGVFLQNYDHAGSYAFGTEGDVFWMISTGISGKVAELLPATELSIED